MKAKISLLLILVTPVMLVAVTPFPANSAITQLWNFKCDTSCISSPTIANGLIYVTSKNVASPDTHLYCINASAGNQVWGRFASPLNFVVTDGYLYVSEGMSYDGSVSCLNAYNGKQIWSCGGTGFSSPAVAENRIYIGGSNVVFLGSAADGNGYNCNFTGFICAVDATTGHEIWRYSGINCTAFGDQTLILSDGYLYAISNYHLAGKSWTNGVYAINASTGENIWAYTATDTFFDSSTAMNGYAYFRYHQTNSQGVSFSGGIIAFDSSNGTILWDFPVVLTQDLDDSFDAAPIGSPVAYNGVVYEVVENSGAYALNASDGKIICHYSVEQGLTYSSLTPPLIVDDKLYLLSSVGLHCFNLHSGTMMWSFIPADNKSFGSSPVYANGLLFVGYNTSLYAINAFTGNSVWNYTFGYAVGSPLIDADTVYIGGSDLNAGTFLAEGGVVIALKPDFMLLPPPTSTPSQTSTSPTLTSSPSPTSCSTPTSEPSPSIPEFPSWFALPFLALMILVAVAVKKVRRASRV
ncbi:MAG: PQQ-binding-like beta-propeller repeat protein [Candidatus Bathyarchaeota archaeon]|nr:PQQ-binding-like beta-propeller repeat protein [Candidatus Bathyarchaeota archaeon]